MTRRVRPTRLVLMASGTLLVACPSNGGGGEGEADDGGSSSDTTAESSDTGESTGTDTGDSTGQDTSSSEQGSSNESTGNVGPACGDGIVDEGEECDDDNVLDGDACTGRCTRPWEQLWSDSTNGAGDAADGLADVVVDAAGNIYVAGFTTLGTDGPDLWIRALDPAGNELWAIVEDGGGMLPDGVAALALHPSGDLLAAGSVGVVDMERDAWLRRLSSSDGAEVWTEIYATMDSMDSMDSMDNSWASVAVDADGNIVVTGAEATMTNGEDVIVHKYGPDGGMPVWTASHDGMAHRSDFGSYVAVDADGNVYVAGAEFVMGMSHDAWLRKYDPDGVEVWTQTHSLLSYSQSLRGVAVDSMGNPVVAGFEADLGVGGNVWVRKYDSTGAELWTDIVAGFGSSDDAGNDVWIDSEDAIYIAGALGRMNQSTNIWLHKYAADGTDVWTWDYNNERTNLEDSGSGVAVDADGNVIVVGGETLLGQGRDAFIAKLAQK